MNIEKIKLQLTSKLPGEKAHQKMMPFNRPISSIAKQNSTDFKESGVAVILYKHQKNLELILIQRSTYEGNHSGQISFPGGKKEALDRNLFETSIRECYEEIGVQLALKHHVGKLTPVFIPVSNFHVEVHLFYMDSKPVFQADPHEVSEIFSVQINDLLNDKFVKITDIKISEMIILKEVPYFDLENKIIWGATAFILSELKELLRDHL